MIGGLAEEAGEDKADHRYHKRAEEGGDEAVYREVNFEIARGNGSEPEHQGVDDKGEQAKRYDVDETSGNGNERTNKRVDYAEDESGQQYVEPSSVTDARN